MNIFYENLENNTIRFENNNINIILNDNEIWFNANGIALSLGYNCPKDAIKNNVEKEDKIKLEDINIDYEINKHPHSIYINESGLYSLIMQSRLKKAKKFKSWITKIVLPSIRKFGYYKLKKKHESDINEIMKKISFLEKQNNKLKNELKPELFPNGSLVYVADYTDEQPNIYRIGKSDDMNRRKTIYNTHTIYKKKIILIKEVSCPLQFETCLKSMLYNYRIKNKKDFYECDIEIIKRAFQKCEESIKCMNQKGGSRLIDLEIMQLKKKKGELQIKLNNCVTILSM